MGIRGHHAMMKMAGTFLLVATVGAFQPDGNDEAGFQLGNHAIVADSDSLYINLPGAQHIYPAKIGPAGIEVDGDVKLTDGASLKTLKAEVTALKAEVSELKTKVNASTASSCQVAVILSIGDHSGASNSDMMKHYTHSFWTSSSTAGYYNPDQCGVASEDVKTEYWAGFSLGSHVTIKAHKKSSGETLGVAVYPVLSDFQDCSLYQVLNGMCTDKTKDVTFTGAKDATLSSGSIRGNSQLGYWNGYRRGQGGGQDTSDAEQGDLFIDHSEALVANVDGVGHTFLAGAGDPITKVRLATQYIFNNKLGPHALAGLGGYHYRNTWHGYFESSPLYGYCPGLVKYDIRHITTQSASAWYTGNVGGPTHNPFGDGCFNRASGYHGTFYDVEFSIHVSGTPLYMG